MHAILAHAPGRRGRLRNTACAAYGSRRSFKLAFGGTARALHRKGDPRRRVARAISSRFDYPRPRISSELLRRSGAPAEATRYTELDYAWTMRRAKPRAPCDAGALSMSRPVLHRPQTGLKSVNGHAFAPTQSDRPVDNSPLVVAACWRSRKYGQMQQGAADAEPDLAPTQDGAIPSSRRQINAHRDLANDYQDRRIDEDKTRG